jgi:hypothetical protein
MGVLIFCPWLHNVSRTSHAGVVNVVEVDANTGRKGYGYTSPVLPDTSVVGGWLRRNKFKKMLYTELEGFVTEFNDN